MGSSLFHKALKEAFEAFCNKQVAGCTIAEIMANFCNNLLKRVSTRHRRGCRCFQLQNICIVVRYALLYHWLCRTASSADRSADNRCTHAV